MGGCSCAHCYHLILTTSWFRDTGGIAANTRATAMHPHHQRDRGTPMGMYGFPTPCMAGSPVLTLACFALSFGAKTSFRPPLPLMCFLLTGGGAGGQPGGGHPRRGLPPSLTTLARSNVLLPCLCPPHVLPFTFNRRRRWRPTWRRPRAPRSSRSSTASWWR